MADTLFEDRGYNLAQSHNKTKLDNSNRLSEILQPQLLQQLP